MTSTDNGAPETRDEWIAKATKLLRTRDEVNQGFAELRSTIHETEDQMRATEQRLARRTGADDTTGETDMIAAAERDQFNAETFAVLADQFDAIGARDALLRMGADAELVDRAYNTYGGYR